MPGSASSERLRRVRDARESRRAAGATAAASPYTEPGADAPAWVDAVSRAGVAAFGTAGSGLPVVDASEPLDPSAPGALVRDADGRIWIDLPYRRALGGRRRIGVDGVLGMTGLGPHLVRATFARWPARSLGTIDGEIRAARHLVAPMAALGLSTVAPRDLPVDLFERIEGYLRAEHGSSELPVLARTALNAVRRTMRRMKECAHVECRIDATIEGGAPDWTLTENLPEPVAAGRWGMPRRHRR